MYPHITENNHTQPTDAQLIERIQVRDADWRGLFGTLVSRHQPALFARCLAYLRNREDAADAAQETLFRAYRAIDGFKGDAAFRTWLFAIADNQCHSLAHKRARYWLDEQQQEAVRTHHELLSGTRDLSADLEARDCVRDALQRIQHTGREVLQLRYFADLSLEEIAATLGVGLSATKMRLYRAQDQVAGLLRDCVLTQAA